jgi:hypothetical protein
MEPLLYYIGKPAHGGVSQTIHNTLYKAKDSQMRLSR